MLALPADAPASQLVALPRVGRRFAGTAEVRLGDTDPHGRLRLDALARLLQDVANDDARDAELPNAGGWVVRRTLMWIERPARLGERLALTTFCAGTGRSWAERRTSIFGDQGAAVEAVSLWVQVDIRSGRPRALDEHFHARYGAAAAGRKVSARLSLPGPDASAHRRPWPVRAADLDVFGHVNNAVQLAIVEELLVDATGDGGHDTHLAGTVETADTPLAGPAEADGSLDGPADGGADDSAAGTGAGAGAGIGARTPDDASGDSADDSSDDVSSRRSSTRRGTRLGIVEIEYLAPLDHVVAELRWVRGEPADRDATDAAPRIWAGSVPPGVLGGSRPGSGTMPAQNERTPSISAWLVVDGGVRTAARWTPA